MSVQISKSGAQPKFKALYTLVMAHTDKAEKPKQSLPPPLHHTDI